MWSFYFPTCRSMAYKTQNEQCFACVTFSLFIPPLLSPLLLPPLCSHSIPVWVGGSVGDGGCTCGGNVWSLKVYYIWSWFQKQQVHLPYYPTPILLFLRLKLCSVVPRSIAKYFQTDCCYLSVYVYSALFLMALPLHISFVLLALVCVLIKFLCRILCLVTSSLRS